MKRSREKLSKFTNLEKLSKEFDGLGLGQASEVMREIVAVPTIFPQIDQVLGVGGWPTDRFALIHGESNGGKSEFTIGLMLSFLKRDHAVLYIDAEKTTPRSWLEQLMGDYVRHPLFRVCESSIYEEVVDAVRDWATKLAELRVAGKVPKDTTGIVVLDSIRKLTPKKLLDRLLKEDAASESTGSGKFKKSARGVDGMAGRAAQHKAALNAQWLDELTALLYRTRTCMVAIARETEDPENFDGVKIGGGKALFFEASVVARIQDAAPVKNDAGVMIAERHVVTIRKTKIAGKLVKYPAAHFYVSTGSSSEYGFDEIRDLFELGLELGVVEQNGSHYGVGDVKLGQGEEKAIQKVRQDPELSAKLTHEVRSKFMPIPDLVRTAPEVINRKGPKKPEVKKAGKRK